jgi:hypothetical protein
LEEIDIGFDATAHFTRASPTKVRDKLAKMKSDLTSIIRKWERSGQGDGSMIDEEYDNKEDSAAVPKEKFDWGWSKGQTGAFDCCESFLGPMPSYLLYFWDILDITDLFATTVNRLSNDIGASLPNEVPGVILDIRNSSKTNSTDDISVFVSSFRDVIVEASKEANVAANRRHCEPTQDKDWRHKEAQEAQDKQVVMKSNRTEKGYIKRSIDTLQDEARNIRFKIFQSNEMKKNRRSILLFGIENT